MKSDLQKIPGIGPNMEGDLISLGVNKISDLKGKNPEELYQKLMKNVGAHVDKCVLYVFRGAVYYAENTTHDPKLLKWWNWKD